MSIKPTTIGFFLLLALFVKTIWFCFCVYPWRNDLLILAVVTVAACWAAKLLRNP